MNNNQTKTELSACCGAGKQKSAIPGRMDCNSCYKLTSGNCGMHHNEFCSNCNSPFIPKTEEEIKSCKICRSYPSKRGYGNCNCDHLPPKETKEDWGGGLKKLLNEQIITAIRMVSIMNPKSQDEIIATVMPNLHIEIFGFISQTLTQQKDSIIEMIEGKKIGHEEHLAESEQDKSEERGYNQALKDIIESIKNI